MTAMAMSHYFVLVFLVQVLGGVLLLANRYVPLALTVLAPVIVNILNFHVLMNPSGIGPGLLATVLWIVVFVSVRSAFRGILQAKVAPPQV
jgi:peptidoglycan biosynthesis protein MviN/MurJ (putative lipid II flippase)